MMIKQRRLGNVNDREKVVLVDEEDGVVGKMDKDKVHGKQTALHRGFSLFLFRSLPKASERQVMVEVLVQKRALTKQTWPGVWSNSCCGHPAPGESYEQAVRRRVREELGVEIDKLQKIADYRYRFERDGVVENEICPVLVGRVKGKVKPNLEEVGEIAWLGWDEFVKELENDKVGKWSEWCKEEVKLVGNKYKWLRNE